MTDKSSRKTDRKPAAPKPAKPAGDKAKAPEGAPGLNLWVGAGIGAGIGSAAVAAALLYANRRKKPPPPRGPKDGGDL